MDPPQAVDERGHLGREGNGRNDGPEPYPDAFDYGPEGPVVVSHE